MSVYETLVKARAMIEDEKNWSSKGYGDNGKRCALHAIYDAAGVTASVAWPIPAHSFFIRHALNGGGVAAYNDSHTHSKVLKKFDRAIRTAKERGE